MGAPRHDPDPPGRDALPPSYDTLSSPGTVNRPLQAALENDEPLPESGPCNLCRIDRYPYGIGELVYRRDEQGYVVGAEDRRGHTIRNMVVSHVHGTIPEDTEPYKEVLRDITAGQIGEGWMLVLGSMSTFPDHFHLIACDLDGDDLRDIHDYELYRVDGGEAELVEERTRSAVGEALL